MVDGVDTHLTAAFSTEEIVTALKMLKAGKSPGPGSNHPELLLHAGEVAIN